MFSKNRDRLLESDIAARFLSAVLMQPEVKLLLSTEHFSVDGTLKTWALCSDPKGYYLYAGDCIRDDIIVPRHARAGGDFLPFPGPFR